MSYILVIVESPAKCKKIEKILGSNYKVMGSYGHIRQLNNLNQINDDYECNYDIIDSKKKVINDIKKAIKNSIEVVLATDDDREGESIAWHIADVFNLNIKTTKRIIFHEITEKAIKEAIENPKIINMNLVNAQKCRQILDLLVGFKITPLLWKNITSNKNNSLSAGRCQTPALRLIYDNYKEIENNPGKLCYNISGYFTSNCTRFELNKDLYKKEELLDFLEKSKIHKHILKKDEIKEVIKTPPQPYTTSLLQQSANNKFNFSPKETMSLAQKLYELGYITYMRTDSMFYSEEFIASTIIYIEKIYNKKYVQKNIEKYKHKEKEKEKQKEDNKKKNKKDKNKKPDTSQEAHEAIRPTNINVKELEENENINKKHIKLYKLIWTNSLQSLMADAVFNRMNITINAPLNYYYKYSAEIIKFIGYLIVEDYEKSKENLTNKANYSYFETYIDNKEIDYKKIVCEETLKELVSHINECKLVKLLEQKGIGRPSTFSSLVDKIQERKYVNKENVQGIKKEIEIYTLVKDNINIKKEEKQFKNEKNKLVITQIGIFVIEFLIKYFDTLFDYNYTNNMEKKLDEIANNNEVYKNLCNECNIFIEELIKNNELTNKNSTNSKKTTNIQIDDKHTYYIGKNGPVIKYKKEDDSLGFYSVKSDINIDKLKNNEYKLEELIETNDKLLGMYKNKEVYLKNGKFGYYIENGDIKKSLNYVKINIPHKNITLEDAIQILDESSNSTNKLIRKINDDLSIRTGKYGDYIFYKTDKMKKPQFLKLTNFENDYKTCDIKLLKNYIIENHKIVVK